MLLYFEDPVSLTGCTIVPHSLVLSYASSYELLFECVTRNGEQPVDIGSLGLSWTAVITPSFDTTATPLASASLPEGSVSGNKITVPLKTFSSAFYKYTAGRHTAPAVLSMRGYKIKDVEATCAAAFQFWIQVQGRPNQDCVPDELLILGTELQKEISDRMEADDYLQQEIDDLKESGAGIGDMLKEVYDKNNNGIVDSAESIGTATAAQVEDAVRKAHAHTNKPTLDKVGEQEGKLLFDGKDVSGGIPNWDDIEDKPSEFPPAAHTHEISQVTGLQDALTNAGKVKTVNGQPPDDSGNITLNIPDPVVPGQWLELTSAGKLDAKAVNTEAGLASYQKVTELNTALDTRVTALESVPTNLHTEADPAVDFQTENAQLGTGWQLDGSITKLTFFDQVYNMNKVRLRAVTTDSAVTGNVVLVPVLNGQEQESVVVPVSATLTVVDVPVNGSGALVLSRDVSDARDTLKNASGAVGMFITNIWKVYEL